MKRVLSIDGGGIRGLIPAVVCKRMEEWSGVPLHRMFDLIAGTSTGGIIAMGLAVPPEGKAAQQLVDFYKTDGVAIFSRPRGWLRYWKGSKYDNSKLNEIARKYFGDVRVSEAVVDILVVTYDIKHRRPFYISRHAAKAPRNDDYLMREVAMGTSAAPTYFPPFPLKDHVLIDGGMVANNPACLAFAEAKRLWPTEDILLVSIGTGTLTRLIPYEKAKSWGIVGWVSPLIDCIFDGTAKAAEDFFRDMMPRRYWRFQGGLAEFTETLDSVSDASIVGLQQIGESIALDNKDTFHELFELLRQAGRNLRAQIEQPQQDQPVRPKECVVEGSIDDYSGELLYLFTGSAGRYWPSARIVPQGNRWQGGVNLGITSATETITLAAVDQPLADYIEFYRANAGALSHAGMSISKFPLQLDQTRVVVNDKVPIEPNVLALLTVEKERCRERNVAFFTPNLLLALLGPRRGVARRLFDRACPGKAEGLVDKLRKYEPLDGPGAAVPFDEFDWHDRDDIKAACCRAIQDDQAVVNARYLLLGILDTESPTRKELRQALGDEGFDRLRQAAEAPDEPPLTPGVNDLFNRPERPESA